MHFTFGYCNHASFLHIPRLALIRSQLFALLLEDQICMF
jgi:hypothetical protein